jgi:hypothetical protein
VVRSGASALAKVTLVETREGMQYLKWVFKLPVNDSHSRSQSWSKEVGLGLVAQTESRAET